MATSAAKKPRKSRFGGSQGGLWQSVLVYPTLAIALITAVPTWIEQYQKWNQNIMVHDLDVARRQAAFWAKNFSCSQAPFAWYSSPSDVKVDATICNSGDIFVHAVTPDNREHLYWVGLDEVLKRQAAAANPVVPAASAATLPGPLPFGTPRPAARLFHQSQAAVVLCQKFLDERRILRRVQTPQGCFDEIIDTYNGLVVEKKAAPCVPQC